MNRTRHPLYATWASMRSRCECATSPGFKNYGAKGVKVCKRWDKFEHFVSDMGERPIGASLDRIDPHGNYEPANCRWADHMTQSNNKRVNKPSAVQWITIPDRLLHKGIHKVTFRVRWECIYCGKRRGLPRVGVSSDGRFAMEVTRWTNPCGHVERYMDVIEHEIRSGNQTLPKRMVAYMGPAQYTENSRAKAVKEPA